MHSIAKGIRSPIVCRGHQLSAKSVATDLQISGFQIGPRTVRRGNFMYIGLHGIQALHHQVQSKASAGSHWTLDGPVWIWRSPGERYSADGIVSSGGDLLVCGCFLKVPYFQWKELWMIQQLEIVDNSMLPTLWKQIGMAPSSSNMTVTSDKARSSKTWRRESGVVELDWLDFNQTEHFHDELEQWLRARSFPTLLCDLTNAPLEEWAKIPINTPLNLVDSLPRRVEAVIAAKVDPGHIKHYGLRMGSYLCSYSQSKWATTFGKIEQKRSSCVFVCVARGVIY